MKCEYCGEKNANVKYTQIVNGVKKEMSLCSECADKLGITQEMNFNMGMNFPSLLGSFLEDYDNSLLPGFTKTKQLTCENCGMTYEDFINHGMLGCINCYDVFEDRMDSLLKNIQSANRHIGRRGRVWNKEAATTKEIVPKKEMKKQEESKLDVLKKQLKIAIKEEKYEEAAKIRDKIKKMEK